jgi:muconolactone delta-isomerase
MRRPRLASKLFRLARQVNDVEAITSGDPKRMARRAKNKVVGRLLARAGFWRRLWR